MGATDPYARADQSTTLRTWGLRRRRRWLAPATSQISGPQREAVIGGAPVVWKVAVCQGIAEKAAEDSRRDFGDFSRGRRLWDGWSMAGSSAGVMDYRSEVWKRPKVRLFGRTTARKMAVGIDSLLRLWCFWQFLARWVFAVSKLVQDWQSAVRGVLWTWKLGRRSSGLAAQRLQNLCSVAALGSSSAVALRGNFSVTSNFYKGKVWLGHGEGSTRFTSMVLPGHGTTGVCRKGQVKWLQNVQNRL